MKKIINYRPVFFCAIFLIIASAFSVAICRSSASRLWIMGIAMFLFVAFLAIRLIFKIKIFSLFAAICLFVSIPFLSTYVKSQPLGELEKYSGQEVVVTGKVSEVRTYKETTLYCILDEAAICENDSQKEIAGKVAFYVEASFMHSDEFKLGRFVTVKGKFNFLSLTNQYSSMDARSMSKGIVAKGYVNFYDIEFSDKVQPTLRDTIHEGVYDKLSEFGGEYSDIGYAMLFGDSSVIDDEIVDTFRSTGIAHLLAVSGLHVSVIVLTINFILKKIRSPKIVNICIITALLLMYCYICDFSISVIRASFMAVFLLYARLRGKPYDRLTVLSLIAIIILVLDPLQIFSISFILSFAAVLSIVLLLMPLSRLLSKVFYKKFAEMVALIFAVQIGLLAITVFVFGRFSLMGFLTNFVSVPLASFGFMFLIYALILSFILPPLSPVLSFFSMVMSVVVKFNFWSVGLGLIVDFSQLKLVAVLGIMIVIFILSDYVFVKRNTKVICSLVILAVVFATNLLILAN